MDKIAFYGVLVINAVIMLRNSYLIIKGRIRPSLAMWLFFSIAMTGTLVSYLLEGGYSPLDNILNTSDIVLCVTLSLVIFFYGGKEARFNRFELGCLALVGLILLFWAFSRAHLAANISLQLIQLIAYVPVYHRMHISGENTESFLSWGLICAVALLSLPTAEGTLALIYSLRASVCTGVLLLQMLRMELKGRERRLAVSQGL